MAGAFVRREVFDAGGFRQRRPAAPRQRGDRVRVSGRVVARPDDGGEHERVPAVPVRQRVEVGDVDVDRGAGFDVRDLLLEDVRPPLHEQARPVAAFARLPVDGLGFLLLAQDAPDGAVPDHHQELADRRLLGQREEVDGLDLRIERVPEPLPDLDGADVARDGRVHRGVLEGEGHVPEHVRRIARPAHEHRSRAGIRRFPPHGRLPRRTEPTGLLPRRGLRDDPDLVGGGVEGFLLEEPVGDHRRRCGRWGPVGLSAHGRPRLHCLDGGGLRGGRCGLGGRGWRRRRAHRAGGEADGGDEERRGGRCMAALFVHGCVSGESAGAFPRAMAASIGRPSGVVAVTRRNAKSGSPSSSRCSVARRTRPRGSALSMASE